MLIEVKQLLDEGKNTREDGRFWRELIFLFYEGVVEVKYINMFRAGLHFRVHELWRVKCRIVLKNIPIKSHIPAIENGAHVAFDKD